MASVNPMTWARGLTCHAFLETERDEGRQVIAHADDLPARVLDGDVQGS